MNFQLPTTDGTQKRVSSVGRRQWVVGRSKRGLTFIETLVWVAMIAVIFQAIASTLLYFYKTNAYGLEQATAVTSAQRGLEQVVRTIREGAYSSQGAFPIHSIAANDIVFYADVDSDSLIERVHYYIQGTDLIRGVLDPSGNPPDYVGTETTTIISDYVRNTTNNITTFRYYDELGSEITNYNNWTAVRFVKVTLAINVNPITLPNQLTLNSSAAIRNLIGH